MNALITNSEYFDCECESNYIHRKSDRTACPNCHQSQHEMPDSIVSEVAKQDNHYMCNSGENS